MYFRNLSKQCIALFETLYANCQKRRCRSGVSAVTFHDSVQWQALLHPIQNPLISIPPNSHPEF